MVSQLKYLLMYYKREQMNKINNNWGLVVEVVESVLKHRRLRLRLGLHLAEEVGRRNERLGTKRIQVHEE